jgi:hypothetical protein
MPLTIEVIPGYQFAEGEKLDQTKLNQLGRPTLYLQGAISSAVVAPGSITSDKLSPTLISTLTPQLPVAADLVMFEQAGTGLRRATVNQLLSVAIPLLPTIQEVHYGDDVFVIQKGENKQATVIDTVREIIFGQDEITSAGGIDKFQDMLMLWDYNSTEGTNKNRKARIGNVVASYTNSMIASANPFNPSAGPIDPELDEVLMKDNSLAPPDQQVRIKIKDLLAQNVGIKAWANIQAVGAPLLVVTTGWDVDQDVISTGTDNGLSTGDFIWFRAADSGAGVTAGIPYYVGVLTPRSFQLYKNKPGAMAADPLQRVDLNAPATGRAFLMWSNPPFRGEFNIAAIIRTIDPSGSSNPLNQTPGYFRIYFETPLPTANYAVQVTGSYFNSDKQKALACGINVSGTGAVPPTTLAPTAGSFDVVSKQSHNDDPADPNYLMVTVFA